jgi:hypothetical protein
MKKKLIIPLAILFIVIIGVTLLFFILTNSTTVKAQLIYEKGGVSVNNQQVQGNTKLKQGDSIQTSLDGEATVILYESIMVVLEPDTEIIIDNLIKSHPKIIQSKGETWNKFTNLFGVEEYTITSGNSVASVRGTSFILTENKIIVDEGEVEFTIDGEDFLLIDEVIEKIGEEINRRELTLEERARVKLRIERLIDSIKKLREVEINKNSRLLSFVKSQYGITDEDIRIFFEDADSGKIDLYEFKEKSPFKIESLEKIIKLTEKINELKKHSLIL